MLVFSLVLGFTGCFSETSDENPNKLGDYEVEIASAKFGTSYDDKKVVIITYKFTNNSSEAQAFYFTIEESVYQNGVECEPCYVYSYNGEEFDDTDSNDMKQIKEGKSIDVVLAYYLNDTSDIEVECEEVFSFSDKVVKKTFSYEE